jgi:hypothetical protein
MTSILDRTIGEGRKQGAFKVIPTGKYVLRVVDVAQRKANDKDLAELKIRVIAPMQDQDLEGINLEKARARGTLWLTDNAFGLTSRAISAINPGIPEGLPLRDALELLMDTDFIGVLEHVQRKGSDRIDVELDIKQVYAA